LFLATLKATRVLWGAADRPKALAPALAVTIVAGNVHGLLMAAAPARRSDRTTRAALRAAQKRRSVRRLKRQRLARRGAKNTAPGQAEMVKAVP
jgi:hypothetical protein